MIELIGAVRITVRYMITESRVSTHDTRADRRLSLIRDAAFNLFNLEVNLGGAEPASLAADIHISRGPLASIIDVNTSWSVVERTRARARAATSGNFLVYLIKQGGSWFRNERGREFRTVAGSVVVGSQDAAYKAEAAKGHDWGFHALSVPQHLFYFSGDRIRHGGFQLVPAHVPLSGLLSTYLDGLCRDFSGLDAQSTTASLRGLDHLLAASLGGKDARSAGLANTVANERFLAALRYIKDNVESPGLSPRAIAAHLCISQRQLHRAFEARGRTVSAEIRRLRLERACDLLRHCPAMPVTQVALSCGFDSLATFYRAFKAGVGMTASELRSAKDS